MLVPVVAESSVLVLHFSLEWFGLGISKFILFQPCRGQGHLPENRILSSLALQSCREDGLNPAAEILTWSCRPGLYQDLYQDLYQHLYQDLYQDLQQSLSKPRL